MVIDASVALKWVLDEPGHEAAEALLDQDLIAPAFWLVEAVNVLWRRAHRCEITDVEARERLLELHNAPVEASAIEDDLMAAAIREDTHVVTADVRFHSAVAQRPELAERVGMLVGSNP